MAARPRNDGAQRGARFAGMREITVALCTLVFSEIA
jgi:hypothetical protein